MQQFLGVICLIIAITFVGCLFRHIWKYGFFGERENHPENRKDW